VSPAEPAHEIAPVALEVPLGRRPHHVQDPPPSLTRSLGGAGRPGFHKRRSSSRLTVSCDGSPEPASEDAKRSPIAAGRSTRLHVTAPRAWAANVGDRSVRRRSSVAWPMPASSSGMHKSCRSPALSSRKRGHRGSIGPVSSDRIETRAELSTAIPKEASAREPFMSAPPALSMPTNDRRRAVDWSCRSGGGRRPSGSRLESRRRQQICESLATTWPRGQREGENRQILYGPAPEGRSNPSRHGVPSPSCGRCMDVGCSVSVVWRPLSAAGSIA
jgi:hypothetical protein